MTYKNNIGEVRCMDMALYAFKAMHSSIVFATPGNQQQVNCMQELR